MASTITTTGPLFQAGGLASGLDTNSIVDAIITAKSAAMLQVQKQQTAYSVQISTVANLTSKLKALQSASDALATGGLAPNQPDGSYSDFTVSGSPPREGSYSVQVETLARAAKLRTATTFSSAQDPAAVGLTGPLQFSIDGVTSPATAIDMTGKSLADIAAAINTQIPGLTASVVATGSAYSLSVARNTMGFTTTQDQALQVVGGVGLGLVSSQLADNAVVKVDGLEVTRHTNSVSGVIPGVTLNLRANSNVATDVNFVSDTSSATTNINSFITAYNDVATLLNTQMRPDPSTAATNNAMAGTYMLSLQRDMHNLLSQKINTTGSVQTLADLNVSLQDDGTLALDASTFQSTFADALSANPDGANAIFSNDKTGIGSLVDAMVNRQIGIQTVVLPTGEHLYVDGALVSETKVLNYSVTSLDQTVNYWQTYLANERTRLTAQFTAMEATIATLNTASNYLNALSSSSGTSTSSGYTYKTTSNG